MDITNQTEQTKQMFAELFDKVISCYTWANNSSDSDEDKLTVDSFKQQFKDTMHDALKKNDQNAIKQFITSVDEFMNQHNIQVTYGGRRRKSASSSSRPRGRRSSKKRGTQRKQKRRQRRGSRRAY